MKIIDVKNSQDIILRGCLYDVNGRDTCVLFIPGMAGNIIENKFIQVLGEEFQKHNIGFICAHNQGSFHIVDYPYVNKDKFPRRGVAFEQFDDCISDISAYMDYIKELGYKQIIIAGHSLGANKVIYYLSKIKSNLVKAYILLSPADMASEVNTIENRDELVAEAKANIASGEPDKFLTKLVWDYYVLSSARFIDLIENKHSHNLPIISNKGSFAELKSIKLPLLAVAGEKDDCCSDNIENYLSLLIKNTDFIGKYSIIEGASHTYYQHEQELFNVLYSFVSNLK